MIVRGHWASTQVSFEKLQASIYRPKRSMYFAIPSPITGLFSNRSSSVQCQDMDTELGGSWLRGIQQVPQIRLVSLY